MTKSAFSVEEVFIKYHDKRYRYVEVRCDRVVQVLGIQHRADFEMPVLLLLVDASNSEATVRVHINVVDATEMLKDSTSTANGFKPGPPVYAGSYDAGVRGDLHLRHVFVTY